VYAITSEPQYLADQAHAHWDLSFDNVGDPHQEIPRICNERGWLTLYASRGDTTFLQRGAQWKIEHPKGFFQPGVLALTQSSRVLYRWRSVPSSVNLNGTAARPTPEHVWYSLESFLAAGDKAADVAHDDNPEIDMAPPPRLVFLAALIANGWFIRAKSFVYSPGLDSTPARFKKAFSRWPVFIALWVAAFIFLPPLWVGLGLVCWCIWIVRDIHITLGRMDVQEEIKTSR
jgi:hypothetical protein